MLCNFVRNLLILSFLIFVASFGYADNAVNANVSKKVITVATLSNFQMVAKPLIEKYLKSKGLDANTDVNYVVGVSNEELISRVLGEPNVDIVFAGSDKTIKEISSQKKVYNNSIYSYGHIELITGKGKTIQDFMSCNFNVLVVPDPNKTTYGGPSIKFLSGNKIKCPKAEIVLANNTLEAGSYIYKDVDFIITTTSIAVNFQELQKSGDGRYKNLAVLDLAHQSKIKQPTSIPRYMLILNKDYLDFTEFMHTNPDAHSTLNTYGFSSTN